MASDKNSIELLTSECCYLISILTPRAQDNNGVTAKKIIKRLSEACGLNIPEFMNTNQFKWHTVTVGMEVYFIRHTNGVNTVYSKNPHRVASIQNGIYYIDCLSKDLKRCDRYELLTVQEYKDCLSGRTMWPTFK